MAAEGAGRVTPATTGPPPILRDSQTPVAHGGNSRISSREAPRPFWEEDVGQRGAALTEARPSELEDRQVVGPSLSENTEDSDLAKAPGVVSHFPDIGKRKQTGLKNRREGIVRSRVNRDLNLYGVVSFGEEVYRTEDSSVVKPVSKRPEQRQRGTSVEATHRSRQAGQPIRAGATTPPFPVTADGTVSGPDRPAPMPVDQNLALEGNRASPSPIATRPEPVAPEPDVFQAKRIAPFADVSSSGIEDTAPPVPPDLPAAEKAGDAGQRVFGPSISEREATPAGDENIPVQRPVEVSLPDAQAPESFPVDPRDVSMARTAARPSMPETGGPNVHIGLLEVVVLAPENAPGRKTSNAPTGQAFASRHYLRNF